MTSQNDLGLNADIIAKAQADFESLVNLLGACAADSIEVADRRGKDDVFGRQASERAQLVRDLLRGDSILNNPLSPLNQVLSFARERQGVTQPVSWVLERNVFSEKCFDSMIEHFNAKSIPYAIVSVVPFIHEIDGEVPAMASPVVVYGSIGIQKMAKKHAWEPGIFGDAEAFSEAEAARHLQSLYLNYGQMRVAIKTLGDNTELYAGLLAGTKGQPATKFFIKPNTDTKEFAGQVVDVASFKEWYAGMLQSGYLEDNDFEVVISQPKKLGCEWRVVVVDGEISDASIYRQYGIVKPQRHIIPEVAEVVAKAHMRYQPAPIYVIDIAEVGDDFKVIEYNTFNSAGLYACDVGKIIDDINAYLERTQ